MERKDAEKEIRKVSKELAQTEKRIEELEINITESEQILSSGDTISDDQFYKTFDKFKKELGEKMYEWELLTEQITSLSENKDNIN